MVIASDGRVYQLYEHSIIKLRTIEEYFDSEVEDLYVSDYFFAGSVDYKAGFVDGDGTDARFNLNFAIS